MGLKFDRDPLAVEQNNNAAKIVNAYIVYDLSATSIVKISYKKKWANSAYGIEFDVSGS